MCGSVRECAGVSGSKRGKSRIGAGVSADRHGGKPENRQENDKNPDFIFAF